MSLENSDIATGVQVIGSVHPCPPLNLVKSRDDKKLIYFQKTEGEGSEYEVVPTNVKNCEGGKYRTYSFEDSPAWVKDGKRFGKRELRQRDKVMAYSFVSVRQYRFWFQNWARCQMAETAGIGIPVWLIEVGLIPVVFSGFFRVGLRALTG